MKSFYHLCSVLFFLIPTLLYSQPPGVSPLNIKEGFEGDFPPAGWTVNNVLGSNTWEQSTSRAYSGTYSAHIQYQTFGGEDWLITPLYTVSAGDSISFYISPEYTNSPPDTLKLMVSNTTKDVSAFTTVLGTIDVAGLPYSSGWFRYSFPLNAFAGQNIYAALKHTDVNGSGLFIDEFFMGSLPDKDAIAFSVDLPVANSVGKILPAATVKNGGNSTQSFDVEMQISPGGYSSVKNVSGLTSGSSSQIIFDNWTPSVGSYSVKMITKLSGDLDNSNDTILKTVYVYDTLSSYGWNSGVSMPSGRWGHASVFYRTGTGVADTGYIYIFSGADASYTNTTSTLRYNIVSNVWSTMSSNPNSVMHVAAVRIKNKVYIPGGFLSGFTPTNALSIYDIPSDTWKAGAEMPQETGDYAIGSYNDSLIYVIGGYSGLEDLNNVQVYNINTNTWATATPKPGIAASGLRGAILGNKIIVAGGYNETFYSQVKAYSGEIDNVNPLLITWSELTDYPGGTSSRLAAGIPRIDGSAINGVNDYILFTCGDPNGAGSSTLKSTWAYDFKSSSWKKLPDKITGISNVSNMVAFERNDTAFFAVPGGYDGASISSGVEILAMSRDILLPVELTSFTASGVNDAVTLLWSTASELKNTGFAVERKGSDGHFVKVGFVAGKGTTVVNSNYTFKDKVVPGKYTYRLKQIDTDGNFSYSKSVDVNSAGELKYSLDQNYPNPFNPSTSVSYSLKEDGFVSIKIYDMLGREVSVLVNDFQNAGSYKLNYNAAGLSSGVYMVRMETKSQSNKTFSSVRKITLIK